eukprot:2707370-Amphidinium_carterae.1
MGADTREENPPERPKVKECATRKAKAPVAQASRALLHCGWVHLRSCPQKQRTQSMLLCGDRQG